jgi:hypothetical protein
MGKYNQVRCNKLSMNYNHWSNEYEVALHIFLTIYIKNMSS